MGDWEKAASLLKRSEERVLAGWSQGALARDVQGEAAAYDGDGAVAWCMRGADARARLDAKSDDFAGDCRAGEIAARLVTRAIRRAGGSEPEATGWACYNDAPGRTQAECAAVFADAAAECRERRPALTHGELVFLR